MPEGVIRAQLYAVFGSRSEYLKAPWQEVIEQRCRLIALSNVEAEQQAEQDEKLEEQQREMERKQAQLGSNNGSRGSRA